MRQGIANRGARLEVKLMDRSGRIRLSTMEIVLIGALIGSLVLGLWQAWQEERFVQSMSDTDDHQ